MSPAKRSNAVLALFSAFQHFSIGSIASLCLEPAATHAHSLCCFKLRTEYRRKGQLYEGHLAKEREEKQVLEKHMIEMKAQVKDLQYGEGGLYRLTESLNEQIQKFELLHKNYESVQRLLNEKELETQKASHQLMIAADECTQKDK